MEAGGFWRMGWEGKRGHWFSWDRSFFLLLVVKPAVEATMWVGWGLGTGLEEVKGSSGWFVRGVWGWETLLEWAGCQLIVSLGDVGEVWLD